MLVLHSRDSTRLILFGQNHPSGHSQKQTCMRDACIARRPFCNTTKGFQFPEATSLPACWTTERLSIWTGIWHIILISQSGPQGNGGEIRYHCEALLAEWRQLHGPSYGLVWLTRGAVGFLTTQCCPSQQDPLRIEITRQPLNRFDVAARVGSESNRKSPS